MNRQPLQSDVKLTEEQRQFLLRSLEKAKQAKVFSEKLKKEFSNSLKA